MLWKREAISTQTLAGADVRCALLLAAARAFREAEAEAARDPSREGLALAHFAEIVVPPSLEPREVANKEHEPLRGGMLECLRAIAPAFPPSYSGSSVR